MKKIIGIILICPLLLLSFSFLTAGRSDGDVFTCLVAGLDDAAENTDELSVFAYSKSENRCSIVQIPRDTYCNFEGEYGKINRIYPILRSRGNSRDNSMKALVSTIEEYLGVKLDAYAAISMKAFENIVDTLGGITVTVPEGFDISGFSGKIKHGENTLDGKSALLLVRHRASYSTADLGRLDAQKIFLEGLYKTALKKFDLPKLVSIMSKKREGVVADVPLLKLGRVLLSSAQGGIKNAELTMLTLPGEAVSHKGVWYYVATRVTAEQAIRKYLFTKNTFDPDLKLNNTEMSVIDGIYNKKTASYRIHSGGKSVTIQ